MITAFAFAALIATSAADSNYKPGYQQPTTSDGDYQQPTTSSNGDYQQATTSYASPEGDYQQSTPGPAIRDDLRCGPYYGWAQCGNGDCCSPYGWCGNTPDHCGWCNEPNPADCPYQSPDPENPNVLPAPYPSEPTYAPVTPDSTGYNNYNNTSASLTPATYDDGDAGYVGNDTQPIDPSCDSSSNTSEACPLPGDGSAPASGPATGNVPDGNSDGKYEDTIDDEVSTSAGVMPTVSIALLCFIAFLL